MKETDAERLQLRKRLKLRKNIDTAKKIISIVQPVLAIHFSISAK